MVVTIVLFFIEIFFRLFNPQPLLSPMSTPLAADILDFSVRSNKIFFHKTKEYNVTYNTNIKGFRGTDCPYIKKEETTRILILGDSFTFGVGVNDADVYSAILQNKLDVFYDRGKINVINLGILGIGTAQELLLYKKEGIKYNPDIVIVQFCSNDLIDTVYDFNFNVKLRGLLEAEKVRHPIKTVRKLLNKVPLYSFLCEHSHFFSFIRSKVVILICKLRKRRADSGLLKENVNPEEPSYFEEVGKKYFGFLKDEICGNGKILIVLNINNMLKQFPKLLNYLRKQGSDRMYLLDIDIPENGYYSVDHHWNVAGHNFVAERIFKYLTEKELIKLH